MSNSEESVTLIFTADWNEVNNRDGFRPLVIEADPFLQRNKFGGWRIEEDFARLLLRVQIIDRKPQLEPQTSFNFEPRRLSINFFPALRVDSGDSPPFTPIERRVDRRMRIGLTHFHQVPNGPHPGRSKLFNVNRANGHPFNPSFLHRGTFDFTVALAIDGSRQGERQERRRFRSDPEMDVLCGSQCD